MSDILKAIDSRTKLVGQNRLEILMFRLRGRQLFAVNVFKVREVLTLPALTVIPHQHNNILGVIHLRGLAIPVIDLSQAIGMRPQEVTENSTVIVTEYNSTVQAFLVGGVERIANLNWEDILPPPSGAGRNHYLTAFTRLENDIIEIIDVEKVLSEVVPSETNMSEGIVDEELLKQTSGLEIMMVDDSNTALAQATRTFKELGLKVHQASDGSKGLQKLKEWVAQGINPADKIVMLITDAEMPVMDGYMLTTEIRKDPELKDLYVVLHTSLSGRFNEAMVEQVGCDNFLSKFSPDKLATLVQERMRVVLENRK
jgi:two-component system, chemotaxis family, chemotaxis protein CheV